MYNNLFKIISVLSTPEYYSMTELIQAIRVGHAIAYALLYNSKDPDFIMSTVSEYLSEYLDLGDSLRINSLNWKEVLRLVQDDSIRVEVKARILSAIILFALMLDTKSQFAKTLRQLMLEDFIGKTT